MFRHFLKLFLFVTLSFAAMEGFSGKYDLKRLYEKVLKPNYEKITPLKEYAKKRQISYTVSAILALVVFGLFVKYFKLTGALVALLMIGGGIYYLKTQTPAISPYKEKFSELILSPIAQNCCGYRYQKGKITQEEIKQSRLFAPRFKTFQSADTLFMKEGVKVGYVEIEFDTQENASVERFAENIFSGLVIVLEQPSNKEGVIVSERLKQRVADMDFPFAAFFSDLPRLGKESGFELYGAVDATILDRCYDLANEEVAVAFSKNRTYIFYYQKQNPFDPALFADFTLQSAKRYEEIFQKIESLVQKCH